MAATIGKKLALAFGVVTAILVLLSVLVWSSMNQLRSMQDAGANRATEAQYLVEATGVGAEMYRTWADTIINHKLDEAAKAWDEAKKESAAVVKKALEVVDTPEEKAWAKEAEDGFNGFLSLYDSELMPLVKAGKFSGPEIEAVDAKSDVFVQKMRDNFGSILASLNKESEAADKEFDATAKKAQWVALISSLFGVAISLFAGFALARNIVGPVNLVAGMAASVARGNVNWNCDTSLRDALKAREDEVGALTRSMDDMVAYISQKKQVAEAISRGSLNVNVSVASGEDDFGKALVRMVDHLNDVMQQLSTLSSQLASGSDQVSAASQNLSRGAGSQASTVEQISSAVIEMTAQAKDSADKAGDASKISQSAQIAATTGSQKIAATVEAMNGINASSQQISKVIKLIDDIAFQTNLLALNAAVEAARAGKHGKGFAVVAEEVRNLAGRSAKAARETSEMVEASVQKVQEGVKRAEDTALSFQEITDGSRAVANALNDIVMSSNSQAAASVQVSQGLSQVSQVTQQTAQSSEENASAAEELSGMSAQLKNIVSQFQLRPV
jgi:methyl-accepting chemotaxis protein